MTTTATVLDAFDLLAHAEQFELRLDAAARTLAARQGLAHEKAWLEAARGLMARARQGTDKLLTRVLRLPELEPIKGDRNRALMGAAVDAAEALDRAIRATVGDRSPMLETLFRNLKLPVFRKANRDDFEAFCQEFEKRLASSYAKRMLADPDYAPVGPALEELARAFAEWRSIFVAPAADDAESAALREELATAARRIELPMRQARLLAEAALVADPELLESSGILEKMKRRAARAGQRDEGQDELPGLDASA